MEGGGDICGGGGGARKVLVVADPSRESAAALQYALSHAIIENDELILLHVGNPHSWRSTITTLLKRPNHPGSNSGSSHGGSRGGGGDEDAGDSDFLEEMKRACRKAHPKINVKIEKVGIEGNNKASTILSHIEVFSVDVLIVGQRRSLSAAILGTRRNGGSGKGVRNVDTAEYLIEHSKCTCVAVQKKGQNAGYLLNTRTHRNFWLLA